MGVEDVRLERFAGRRLRFARSGRVSLCVAVSSGESMAGMRDCMRCKHVLLRRGASLAHCAFVASLVAAVPVCCCGLGRRCRQVGAKHRRGISEKPQLYALRVHSMPRCNASSTQEARGSVCSTSTKTRTDERLLFLHRHAMKVQSERCTSLPSPPGSPSPQACKPQHRQHCRCEPHQHQ